MDSLSEHWSTNSDNDQSLEHVGLLEEIPHDSVCEWAAAFPIQGSSQGSPGTFSFYQRLGVSFLLSLLSDRFAF